MGLLFLCVANSARSQMAEGLARHILGNKVSIQSAGSYPSQVHPIAIKVMTEIGIDISNQRSKSVEEINPSGIHKVITLCSKEVCPVFLGKAQQIHWEYPNPTPIGLTEHDKVENFRKIRDAIKAKLSNKENQEMLLDISP